MELVPRHLLSENYKQPSHLKKVMQDKMHDPKFKYKKAHEKLHREFESLIQTYLPKLLPLTVAEYKFHPERRYLFDYCWPCYSVAVDIQGGIYINPASKGRRSGHVSPKGMENDMEKINLAQSCGWIMLQFAPNHIRQKPRYVVEVILSAIKCQWERKQLVPLVQSVPSI